MKQLVLFLMILIFANGLSAEMLIINTSQQNYEFVLTDIEGISFDETSMMVDTPAMMYTFIFDEILYLSFDLLTGSEPDNIPAGIGLLLKQNYPNPFNPETNISFSLIETENVKLEIFNAKGQKVRTLVDGIYSAGDHTVNWNGKTDQQEAATSGVYFYRLSQDKASQIKKMILLK